MARPIKEGLSYFPLDVDSDYDDKFQLIESLYGPLGFASVIKIFMKIYSVGYYYKWEEKEELLMAKRIGIDSNSLKNIISDCVKYDLFDEKLFQEFSVLTSDGIQKRFFTAVGKRKIGVIIEDFLLISKEEVEVLCPKMTLKTINQGISTVIHGNTEVIQESSTQSKVKERKRKESKENKSSNISAPDNAHLFYQNNFGIESPTVMETINFWIDDLSEELVIEAMRRSAVDQKGFRYAEGIMKKWLNKNITTMKQVEAEDISFSNQKRGNGSYSKQPLKVEELPNWAQEGYESPKEELMSPESAFGLQYRLYKLQRDDKNRMRIASGFNEQYGEGVFEKFLQDKLIDEAAMQRNGVD